MSPSQDAADTRQLIPTQKESYGEAPHVRRPSLPSGPLPGFSQHQSGTINDFTDVNIATDSIAFVSHMPVTTALSRIPMQVVMAVFAAVSFGSAAIFWQAGIKPEVGPAWEKWLLVCLFIASGMVGIATVVLSRYGKPRWGVILSGLNVLAWAAMQIQFTVFDPDVQRMTRVGILFVCIRCIVTIAFVAWGDMLLRNENRWTSVFIFLGFSFTLQAIVQLVYIKKVPIGESLIGFVWAAATATPAMVMIRRRRKALHEATEAVTQDQTSYDEAWNPILQEQEAALKRLAALVAQHRCMRKEQGTADLDLLLRLATAINGWYQEVVCSWSQYCSAEHCPAPMKTAQRTLEKVYRSYFGKIPPILDLVRSSIVVETIDEVYHVLELVLHEATVHTIKNRFDVAYDGTATAGYRDLNLQIGFPEMDGTLFEGFVFELQVHLRAVIAMKNDFGHKRYIALRNLRGD